MKKWFKIFLPCIFLLQSTRLFSQDHGTGLKLATAEQLNAIPPASTPYSGDELPKSVDLSDKMPPVGNQGSQNSCTAWSIGYALKSYQESIEEGTNYFFTTNNINYTNSQKIFSPSFIYNQLNNGRNAGISIPEALTFLASYGDAKWSDMPYNEYDFTTQPSEIAKQNALNYRIEFYRKVNVLDDNEMKAQLNAGYPVVIGIVTDEAFIQGRIDFTNSVYVWKNHYGDYKGTHAVVVTGYDDNLKAFKIINSWGTAWGNNGYCWIDYQFFKSIVREGYIAKDRINGKRPINTNVPPTSFLTLNFVNTKVTHGVNNLTYGQGMQIEGTVDIPGGYGKYFNISTYIYYQNYNDKGNPVGSANVAFSDINGNAATGTLKYSIPPEGIKNFNWSVFIPYTALNLPNGNWYNGLYYYTDNYILYQPILWIDNFAVSYGPLVRFVLKR